MWHVALKTPPQKFISLCIWDNVGNGMNNQECDFCYKQVNSFLRNVQTTCGGPAEPSLQFVLEVLTREQNGRGVKLITHFYLVPSVRMSGAGPPWRGAHGQVYRFVIIYDPVLVWELYFRTKEKLYGRDEAFRPVQGTWQQN